MKNKKKLVYEHIFEGIIKEYEQILIEFVLDSGRAKSIDPKVQLLLGYIGIHGRLTQKQLKDLTGLSTGTISKKLREILDFGIIRREKLHKSNESVYINAPESYVSVGNSALGDLTKLHEFLIKKNIELEKLKDKKGAMFLQGRISGLMKTIDLINKFWNQIEFIFKQQN
ncbi:MAG: hypothetical protein ACXAAH_06085 [Promethearchaeota archaeon]|jgi:DNA-binding transcriptional regulator GbsR (MarR family)